MKAWETSKHDKSEDCEHNDLEVIKKHGRPGRFWAIDYRCLDCGEEITKHNTTF